MRAAPVDAGEAVDLTGVVKALGEALGTRLEGRSTRSARRWLKKAVGIDLEALPDLGAMLPAKRAGRPKTATVTPTAAPAAARGGLRVPTMARPEVLDRNPHLRAAVGGLKLRLHPADAARAGVHHGDVVTVPVDRVRRTLVVQVVETVPEGYPTVPATADEPVGPAHVDLAKVAVERRALEVA
ncbi:MAG: hypothetical protein P1P87_07020 [Trueperaceae bacterium]|nr:hypothetical protein [Trueperaceae bacterium]